jgi:hypothetical protein
MKHSIEVVLVHGGGRYKLATGDYSFAERRCHRALSMISRGLRCQLPVYAILMSVGVSTVVVATVTLFCTILMTVSVPASAR